MNTLKAMLRCSGRYAAGLVVSSTSANARSSLIAVAFILAAGCSAEGTGTSAPGTGGGASSSGAGSETSESGESQGSSGADDADGDPTPSAGTTSGTQTGFECNGGWSCSMATTAAPASEQVSVVFASVGSSCSFVDPNGSDEIEVQPDKKLTKNGKTVGTYTFTAKTRTATFGYDVGDGAVQLSACKKNTY